jgi:hypothetical protein
MTPEQIDKTIEFLLQHAAAFSIGMDEMKLRQQELQQSLIQLANHTAKLESWAAEVVAIEARRLDEPDQLHKETLRLIHRLLDRLPPQA